MPEVLTPEQIRDAYELRVRELTETLESRERQLSILSAVAAGIHGVEDVPEILDIALREILEGLDLTTAWVFMGNREDRKLHLAASRGVAECYLEEIRRDGLGECLCPEVFWTGHRMEARNTTQCPRMPTIVEGLSESVAHACIPLQFEGESRGVLNVAARPGGRFSDDELSFLETLGHQICVAIERSGAQQRLVQNEKMVLLGTFAAGLAHEIRNPLNSIGLQLSILERRFGKLEGAGSAELQELAGVIRGEIRRLDALVGDFLLFARSDRIQYTRGSLEELTDEVVGLLRPEALQSGVTLRRQRLGSVAIPVLSMNPEKMKQVVINLVRNAIEAQPEGGAISVETGSVGGQARLVVRDSGPGLPPGLDIFQLFVTTKPRGTGLGLSLVQQIVTEHGGEIVAGSEPGKGAVFTVSLPLADAAATQEGAVP